MSTIGKTAIETRMVSMITAFAPLTPIQRVITGMVPEPKLDYCPMIELVIETESWTRSQTGGYKNFVYGGDLVITVFSQDMILTTDRSYVMPTYTALTTYIDALIKLFSDDANAKLQNLTFTNGTVINVLIAENGLIYGAPRFNERDNNLFNAGVVPFTIQTNEADTL